MHPDIDILKIKLFADGADLASMRELVRDPLIRGFTTNPTLMRKAGVRDYASFARQVLEVIPDRPVSFEVLADDLPTMADQGAKIGSWAENVYVKVPITTTAGEFTGPVIRRLHEAGIKVNVTAILTLDQVDAAGRCLGTGVPSIISVFAGRIADTGRDPMPLMAAAAATLRPIAGAELLWASPRELLNIFHAESVGCDIITATSDVLAKRSLIGKDLAEYSLETVKMFYADSSDVGLALEGTVPVAS